MAVLNRNCEWVFPPAESSICSQPCPGGERIAVVLVSVSDPCTATMVCGLNWDALLDGVTVSVIVMRQASALLSLLLVAVGGQFPF